MAVLDPHATTEIQTYANPVHPHDFPDPFVLYYQGEYYAICTGHWKDGRIFGIMHSKDLVHWEELEGALAPLETHDPSIPYIHYWAPEIYRFGEKFYLYYSVGNEAHMHLRVAVADHPAGPYTDSGKMLTDAQFAIDAHVFLDEDGSHYLFYATDFLEHSHIGTGTVVDRLLDPFTLEGYPRPVTRAKYDWQVYDPARKEKGGVRWHTVEGPFVLKRKGVYYEMFSGGNWQNKTYGVSFATSRDIRQDSEWDQLCDGEKVLPILRTISSDDSKTPVIGPGHNSVVIGPSLLEQWCVYHQWNQERTGRVLSIDRVDWVGEEMIVLGPTTDLQELPAQPSINLRMPSSQLIDPNGTTFVIAADCDLSKEGGDSLILLTQSQQLRLRLEQQSVKLARGGNELATLSLPVTIGGFTASSAFRIQLVCNHRALELKIEGQSLLSMELAEPVVQVEIANEQRTVQHFILSHGFEDLFTEGDLESLGWIESAENARAKISEGQLELDGMSEDHVLVKSAPSENYELVVNAKLTHCDLKGSPRAIAYGIYPCLPDSDEEIGAYPLIAVKRVAPENGDPNVANWTLQAISPSLRTMFSLPENFDPSHYQQFRFRKRGATLHIMLGTQEIGTLDVPELSRNVGLFAGGCEAAFEMVRLIAFD
jgi:GH43 family beta-xylosidase